MSIATSESRSLCFVVLCGVGDESDVKLFASGFVYFLGQLRHTHVASALSDINGKQARQKTYRDIGSSVSAMSYVDKDSLTAKLSCSLWEILLVKR